MLLDTQTDAQENSNPMTEPSSEPLSSLRLRLRIPHDQVQKPILADLVRQFPVQLNIRAAMLASSGHEDGWFDVQLDAEDDTLKAAIAHLKEQGVELYFETPADTEDW
jgi:ABC-type methionine transport system ATPase subunit